MCVALRKLPKVWKKYMESYQFLKVVYGKLSVYVSSIWKVDDLCQYYMESCQFQ